jgi:o-succinylbenzoate---CoA ligase
VTVELVPLPSPAAELGPALEDVWTRGAAALPLPVDARPERVGPLLDAARDRLPEGTALVVATSGSTGAPKGVTLGHAALTASVEASVARLGCVPGDRWLLALPVHHVAGIQVLLRARALGTDAVAVAPGDVDAIATAEADHVSLVPTQLARLLDTGADVARFRTILLGGARPNPALLGRAVLAGARVVVSYGMTETCGGCVYDGVPLDGVEVDTVPPDTDDAPVAPAGRGGSTLAGRIRVRGPVLATGVLEEGALRRLADDDGWFTTGDVGQRLDGRLEVFGRADDVVISGGENVPAAVVAAHLRTHPGVADVAVVGRPDPDWGEVVTAVLVPIGGGSAPGLDELREHVRARYPAAYAPRHLVVVDELPRDAMGKLTREVLADLAAEG